MPSRNLWRHKPLPLHWACYAGFGLRAPHFSRLARALLPLPNQWRRRTEYLAMREIKLDGSQWRNTDDVYATLLAELGAPEWHGYKHGCLTGQ